MLNCATTHKVSDVRFLILFTHLAWDSCTPLTSGLHIRTHCILFLHHCSLLNLPVYCVLGFVEYPNRMFNGSSPTISALRSCLASVCGAWLGCDRLLRMRMCARERHRRNHHTIMKNQNTTTRKTMYHNHRQPCFEAMLFIRRKVPARIPCVSAKASFCKPTDEDICGVRLASLAHYNVRTHHLCRHQRRLSHLIPNPNGNLSMRSAVQQEGPLMDCSSRVVAHSRL